MVGDLMPQLNIYLDDTLAQRLDQAASEAGASRSSWVRQAIEARLGPGGEQAYPMIAGDSLPAEVRQGQIPAAVGGLRPVVRQQLELEALRTSSDVDSLVAEAVEAFLLNAGRLLEDDPVGASWGAITADPAEVLRILAEEDALLDG